MTKIEAPYFSVIIPTYERHEMLAEAVDSVRRQTFADWELIVIDDASPTPVSAFEDSRIHLMRNDENLGKAASVNRGLELARGSVVAFLDDDDAWEPERLAHAHTAHSHADVVVCLTKELGQGGETSQAVLRRKRKDSVRAGRGDIPYGHIGSDSVRRDLCPRFDVLFGAAEDWDWGIRLWQITQSVDVIPYEDFLWRRHAGPRHNNGLDARIMGMQLLLVKHRNFFASHPRAHSRRLYGVGMLYLKRGFLQESRQFAIRSIRVKWNLRAMRLLMKTFYESEGRRHRSSGPNRHRS